MKRFIPVLSVVVLLVFAGVAMACPMCKDSIPSSDAANQGGVPGGFNQSVYLLLGTFLAMVGVVSGVIYKGVSSTYVMPRGGRGFPVKPNPAETQGGSPNSEPRNPNQ